MTSSVHAEVVGQQEFRRTLGLLILAPLRRKRLMARVAKKVIQDSKRRVREQRDLDGNPYKERKRKRTHARRKMLSRLVKELKVIEANAEGATVGFYKPSSGRIAAIQQHGSTETINMRSRARRTLNGSRVSAANSAAFSAAAFAQATNRQALELRALGFKAKVNGRTKTAGLSWIKSNMTVAKAGAIIRSMREKQGISRNISWITHLTARSFLGATAAEIQQYIEQIYDDMEQEMNRGIR
jgi:phage virion morphogenesis protein